MIIKGFLQFSVQKSLNRITLYSAVKHTEHIPQFQVLRNLLFKWVSGSETNYGKNKDILDIQKLAYKLKTNLSSSNYNNTGLMPM